MKHWKYLMSLVLVCFAMMFGDKKASAANTVSMTLDSKTVRGTTHTSVCFELKPELSGIIKFRVTYASNDGLKAVLTNVTTGVQKELTYKIENSKTVLEVSFYAEPDQYEIIVDFVNGSRDLNYAAVATIETLDSKEGGKGDSFDEPIILDPTDQKKGVVGFGDNSDCYKIVFSSEGTLKINVTNHSDDILNIKLYDTYKNLIQLDTVNTTSKEIVIKRANGIYFMVLDRVYINGLGTNYTITTGDYIPITNLKLSQSSLTLTAGDVKTLKTTVTPTDATEKYTYKTSNKSVVTVNSSGKIKALKAGSATISVSSVNGRVLSKCKVTVKAKDVKKLTLNKTSATLTVGDSLQLKTTITPSDVSTTLTYASSNKSIATVNDQGKIKAVKAGSCTITVTSKNGIKANCEITVKSAPKPTQAPTPVPTIEVTSIKADSNMYFMKLGESKSLIYTIAPSNATDQSVSFSSLDKSIAKVDDKGVITAVAVGKTIVNAKTSNGKTLFITLIVE